MLKYFFNLRFLRKFQYLWFHYPVSERNMMQHRGIVSRRFLFMIDHASEEDIHLATRGAGKRIGAIVDVALALISRRVLPLARRSIGISKSRAARTYVRTWERARARAHLDVYVCVCVFVCSGRQPWFRASPGWRAFNRIEDSSLLKAARRRTRCMNGV